MSSPEELAAIARGIVDSRNLARRPDLSVVIFDSRVPAYTGQGVYLSAVAEELSGDVPSTASPATTASP